MLKQATFLMAVLMIAAVTLPYGWAQETATSEKACVRDDTCPCPEGKCACGPECPCPAACAKACDEACACPAGECVCADAGKCTPEARKSCGMKSVRAARCAR